MVRSCRQDEEESPTVNELAMVGALVEDVMLIWAAVRIREQRNVDLELYTEASKFLLSKFGDV